MLVREFMSRICPVCDGQNAAFISKRDLYIRKRTPYSRQRDLCIDTYVNEPYKSTKETYLQEDNMCAYVAHVLHDTRGVVTQ